MSVAYFNGKALTGPMGPQGPDGNPIGSIISYLGSTAPEGYLVCDGKEYQIADHSQLAAFFEKEFGSKNHFGGDGTSTFAVPDFRTSNSVNAAVQYCIKATKSFEEDPPQGDISVGVFYNSKTAKVVVPASGWSANAPFTNTVAVADVIANADVQNIMVTPIEQHLNLQSKFGVIATSQGKASLTFTAVTKPDVDIIYYVFVVGSESVQDDIVAWSPKILSAPNNPPYYLVSKGISASSASRLFDDNRDTMLTILNFGDIDSFYFRVNKLNDDATMFVPWTIYGVEFVYVKSSAYNNLPESITLYGTFDNIENVSKIATFYASSVAPIIAENVYRYRFVLKTPVKYSSYVFSAFKSVGSADQGSTISDIYFLRSKTDIIAEGGTV